MYCTNCGSTANKKFCSNCGAQTNAHLTKKVTQMNSKKFRGKFAKVYREIDLLDVKIHQQKGIFFKNHTYTQNELLHSKHHKKISSITRKIGDDVKNWYINGKLSEEGWSGYYEERNKTQEKLHVLSSKIESREPTWWENFKNSVDEFITLIMANLPELDGWLLTTTMAAIERLPAPTRGVLRYIASAVNNSYGSYKRLSQQTQ